MPGGSGSWWRSGADRHPGRDPATGRGPVPDPDRGQELLRPATSSPTRPLYGITLLRPTRKAKRPAAVDDYLSRCARASSPVDDTLWANSTCNATMQPRRGLRPE